MLALSDAVRSVLNWLSFKGRINRRTYVLQYVVPAILLASIGGIFSIPIIFFLCAWLVVTGTTKRWHDTNLKINRGGKFALSGMWGLAIVIASAVAFVFFLGGISGSGDRDLIERAALIFVAPIVIPPVLIFLFALLTPGAPEENEHGPMPASSSASKTTSKYFKAAAGAFAAAAVLLGTGAAVFLFYAYLSQREPALIEAIRAGDADEVRALLDGGGDPNQPARRGTTALLTSMQYGHDKQNEIATLLLEKGADPNALSTNDVRKDYDPGVEGGSPLIVAIRRPYLSPELIELLLQKGANPNPQIAHEQAHSPLTEAVLSRRIGLVALLLEYGADMNAPSNRNALMTAVQERNDRMVELMVTRDIGLDQLESAIAWVDGSLLNDGCRPFLPTIQELLKEAANEQAGEALYELNEHLGQRTEAVQSTTDFSQHFYKKPIAALVKQSRYYQRRYVHAGPGMQYEKAAYLGNATSVDVLAITDAGYNAHRWFLIRYANDQTGYMAGDVLESTSICVEGMRQRQATVNGA